MTPWMRIAIGLLVAFVITFVLTWAIREGGSFHFLHPARWRSRPGAPPLRDADSRPRT